MIKNAKVSLSAVKSFEQAVTSTADYSPRFERGIACLEALHQCLTESVKEMKTSAEQMQAAQEKLAVKIRDIEAILARLTAKRNELESELSVLEDELSSIPESITLTNEEGEEYEVSNPAYLAVEAKISAVESQLRAVDAEIYPHQQRLEHANSVDGRLASQIDATNGVVYSLEEKINTCKQLRADLKDIQDKNLRNGTSASESLKKIETIISNYLRIKMVYEAPAPLDMGSSVTQSDNSINVQLNVNKTTFVQQTINQTNPGKQMTLSAEDIAKHQIRFDDVGRICEYEGRTYGGDYNTYEDRLNHTSLDDPMRGYYEGPRGESKYIPSGRTTEGVVVVEILEQYGLDGIEYRNAEPDFEVCSEAVVQIIGMTENREDYYDSHGVKMPGNFSQADVELARTWNAEMVGGKIDWTSEDVYIYRKENRLTWHEKCDTKTMVLVRAELNLYFKHSGGCSECRVRDAAFNGEEGFDE